MNPLDVLSATASPDGLILASEARRVGLQRELRREFDQRSVIRLRRGVYMRATEWGALSPDARYLQRIRGHAAAAAHAGESAVYSHQSAAALWGLPLVGAWPAEIHIAIPAGAAGGRSRYGIVRHPLDANRDIAEANGLSVTSVADTAVALARVLPFAHAVAAMDKAIHVPRNGRPLASPEDLATCLSAFGRVPGRSAAERVIDFASTLSGSAGESVSRANIFLLGFLLPELQTAFWDHHGLIGYTDFFWRTLAKIGEFDGHGKYVRSELTGGRSPADVVIAEKIREDRLRALDFSVCRWGWDTATSLPALRAFLTRNGVPRARSGASRPL